MEEVLALLRVRGELARMSFRATVKDANGNATTQTIIDAYRIT